MSACQCKRNYIYFISVFSIFFCMKLFTYLPWDHCRAERLLRMSPQFDRILLPAVKMKYESLFRRTKTKLATDKSKLIVAQCKGFRNRESFLLVKSRIQEILSVESEILGLGIQSTALVMRLPLKIGIRNTCSTNKVPEASTLNPKSNVWNPESKTALDPFHWAVIAL